MDREDWGGGRTYDEAFWEYMNDDPHDDVAEPIDYTHEDEKR